MTLANSYATPSDLADVLDQIAGRLGTVASAGIGVTMMVGAQYIPQFGAGGSAGSRVLFVPEKRGKLGPPIAMGNVASMTHSCDVAVRGPEAGDGTIGDIFRFRKAYQVADMIISAISRATSGRREWGDLADDSPLNVDGLGADLTFSFTYQRDIRWDQRIVAVLGAPADTSPQTPPGPVPGQELPGVEALDISIAPEGS